VVVRSHDADGNLAWRFRGGRAFYVAERNAEGVVHVNQQVPGLEEFDLGPVADVALLERTVRGNVLVELVTAGVRACIDTPDDGLSRSRP
jgi:hypothetical protein